MFSLASPRLLCLALALFWCVASLVSWPSSTLAEVKAFPTAEGFGAWAKGGRGGTVNQITTLDDGGRGSLRDCIEASGPRTCIFRVGGTIAVDSSLIVTEPYLTIAGQTAPGDGILLRNAEGTAGSPLSIRTHNVIVRHLRSRPGPSAISSSIDALQIIRNAHDVIIDHASLSWASDENLDIGTDAGQDPYNVTVQWSIIAEGLDNSVHSHSKKHSKGVLLSSGEAGRRDNNFTLHHNLIAHNRDRMPDINNVGITDVVNNVLYNPKSVFGEFWTDYGENNINFVGNVARRGPDTSSHAEEVYLNPVNFGFKLFLKDNIGPRRPDGMGPEDAILDPDHRVFVVADRLPAPPVVTSSAKQSYEDVLRLAGATVPRRDPVDARVVREVRSRTGMVPNHPDDVGGYPDMQSGPVPVDSDEDGMPDDWEKQHGLDPQDPDDRNGDIDANGYTDLEDYLNELAGDPPVRPGRRS